MVSQACMCHFHSSAGCAASYTQGAGTRVTHVASPSTPCPHRAIFLSPYPLHTFHTLETMLFVIMKIYVNAEAFLNSKSPIYQQLTVQRLSEGQDLSLLGGKNTYYDMPMVQSSELIRFLYTLVTLLGGDSKCVTRTTKHIYIYNFFYKKPRYLKHVFLDMLGKQGGTCEQVFVSSDWMDYS